MSNHTLLTIGAFLILSTILLGFYELLAATGNQLTDSQDLILGTTVTESYIELAQGLAFDQLTDTSNAAIGNPSALTTIDHLGPDESAENSIGTFNDFDDFNRFQVEKTATGTNKRFTTTFRVYYVNPNNVGLVSTSQTFVKRLDLKTWRSYPPSANGGAVDTVRMSIALGYFHFD
jgi:hypothetical protein